MESDLDNCPNTQCRKNAFYPRSPHGERPSGVYGSVQPLDFYPRSPHGERRIRVLQKCFHRKFLSTLSAWRATILFCLLGRIRHISIHALRMESDVLRPITVRAFTKKHDGILSFAA